jgi:hypothetical protein
MERIDGKVWVFTKNDIKELLSKKEQKKFGKWMEGQTGVILDSGEFGYFAHDVERFIKFTRFNIPTYFD